MVKRRGKGGKMQGQAASKAAAESALRRIQALTLRASGLSYQQIGKAMGVTRQASHSLVTKSLMELNTEINETAEEVRRLDLLRLDKMQFALWAKALIGDVRAITAILRIMERRAKLEGTEAPTVIDWQRTAEEKGMSASEMFEEMVQVFKRQMSDGTPPD